MDQEPATKHWPDKLLLLQQMQIYTYNSDDFDSLSAALREKRIIAAMAVFFQVGTLDCWSSMSRSEKSWSTD